MTKQELINDILSEAQTIGIITTSTLPILQTVLIAKLADYNLVKTKNELSTNVKDNEWILQRFCIDSIAKGNKKSTIEQYVKAVNRFLVSSNLNYTQVTAQSVTDYLALRQYKDKISDSYKATIYRYLNSFFKWAYRKGHISTDVMLGVDSVKCKPKFKNKLTDDEVAQCRSVIAGDIRFNTFFELMLSTGMRVGELSTIKIEDIDLDRGEIQIWGEKTSTWRTGFLTPSCKLALKQYIGTQTHGYLFKGRFEGTHCDGATLENWLKVICNRANINRRITVHTLRKTFASIVYRKTNDVLLVARLLGHCNADTTIKFYIVFDTEDTKNTMRKIA